MAAVQSPPHEVARQEKLAHLAAVDAREELQRRHAQNAADTGADAERQARVAAFGEAPQASPLEGHQRRRARAESHDAAGESAG